MRKSEQGTLPLLREDVFEEIMRRIVNEYFNIYFDGDRYYKILSEHFLQGWEYELEDLEPGRCADSEEEARRIDEWLKFKKVWWSLKGRPGCRPLKEMLEKTWIAYFKAWILPFYDASMVIDWIDTVPLISKKRTKTQIAELLGCTLTDVNTGETVEDERKATSLAEGEETIDGQQGKRIYGRPKRKNRTFRDLLNVGGDNDACWEKMQKKIEEIFKEYTVKRIRAQIIWLLCGEMKPGDLPSIDEMSSEYNKVFGSSYPISKGTFKEASNSKCALDSEEIQKIKEEVKECLKK